MAADSAIPGAAAGFCGSGGSGGSESMNGRRRFLEQGLAGASLLLPVGGAFAQSEATLKLVRIPKVALVVGNVLALVACGIAIGVPAALYAARFAKAYLFGITENDPLTMAVAIAVLLAAALAAAYAPARTASRLDPTSALRRE